MTKDAEKEARYRNGRWNYEMSTDDLSALLEEHGVRLITANYVMDCDAFRKAGELARVAEARGLVVITAKNVHELKTTQPHFDDVRTGVKKVDIRMDDRGFRVGDMLVLREYDASDGTYSGRVIKAKIVHILAGFKGLAPGYVALSIQLQQPEFAKVELSKREREVMEHAVGAGEDKRSPGYRNHYAAAKGGEADIVWQGLVERGLAALGHENKGTIVTYSVTREGCAAIGLSKSGTNRACPKG